jgi:hypothetical protein
MLDIAAVINIIVGLVVVYLELRVYSSCPLNPNRWVYVVKAASGLSITLLFTHSLLFNGGSVDPSIGRPAITLVLAALAMGAIIQHRRGC